MSDDPFNPNQPNPYLSGSMDSLTRCGACAVGQCERCEGTVSCGCIEEHVGDPELMANYRRLRRIVRRKGGSQSVADELIEYYQARKGK